MIKEETKFMSAGDVMTCILDGYGSVQYGNRPVVIVSNAKCCAFSNTVQVLPITSKTKNDLPTHYTLYKKDYNKLKYEENTVLGEQITTVDKTFLGDKICHLNPVDLFHVIECAKKNFPF